MKIPKITIILPNYNSFLFIKKTINSVINQSYKNWKLIIVDDCSNEKTKSVLKKFSHHKKIKIFWLKKNKGAAYCRNFAIKKSKSKYFAFIDSDDVLEHIKNDNQALNNLKKNLKPKGLILLTIPAYNYLFSKKDVVLKHYRRYGFNQIKNLVSKNFKVLRITFFNTFLFVPIALITLVLKFLKVDYIEKVENTPNKFINNLLMNIFKIELFFLKYIDFPFGVSIIIIGEKKNF